MPSLLAVTLFRKWNTLFAFDSSFIFPCFLLGNVHAIQWPSPWLRLLVMGGGGGISEKGGLHGKGTGLSRRIRGDMIA